MNGPDTKLRDEELSRVLREWKAPAPGARLDERVLGSLRTLRPARSWTRTWLPVAAGIVALGVISLHMAGPGPGGGSHNARPVKTTVKTTMNAAGFEPLPDGAITISSSGEKQ